MCNALPGEGSRALKKTAERPSGSLGAFQNVLILRGLGLRVKGFGVGCQGQIYQNPALCCKVANLLLMSSAKVEETSQSPTIRKAQGMISDEILVHLWCPVVALPYADRPPSSRKLSVDSQKKREGLGFRV